MGLGLQGRAYGSFRLDDGAVALLRDGNAARQEFTLGRTRGDALLTAELGLHAVRRPRPSLPVRAGLRLGGRSGPGIRLDLGWEADRFFVRGSTVTHGGVAGGARGPGGTFGAGLWF